MLLRQSVEHCVEAASLDTQTYTIWRQLQEEGEAAKVIALTRLLPKFALKAATEKLINYSLPINPVALDPVAFEYGSEALAYRAQTENGSRLVVKKFRSYKASNEHLASRTAAHNRYVSAFGSLVVPTMFVLAGSTSRHQEPVVLSIQPEVEGQKFFHSGRQVKPEQVLQMRDGVAEMFNSFQTVPDFNYNNVLVDDEGSLHIIDTGSDHDPERLQALPRIASNFDFIKQLADRLSA